MQICPYCTLAGSSGCLLVRYKRNYYSSSMACKAFPFPHQARDSTLLIESNWNILQRPMNKGRCVSVIAWGSLRITKTFSRMRRSEIKGRLDLNALYGAAVANPPLLGTLQSVMS